MSTASAGTSRRFHGLARFVLWIVATLALLATALWLGVPPLAKHLLQTRLATAISRPVTVAHIAFNPFKLEARIDGLTLGARVPGSPPLLALDAATLEVSVASVWHRAPVLDRVALEHPRIAIARNDDGSYSVQDLIDAALADHEGPPARFSLNNIEVHAGEIDFDDRPKGRRHEVRDLNIGIPFLSSLPYQTTVKVAPHVAARINGSPFGLAGTTTPFAREREASLDIDVDAVSLTQYLAYLPVKLRARIPAATLSSHAKLVFSEGDPSSRSLWLAGEFTLDRFVLQRQDGADSLSIGRASAHVARLDVFNRTLVIDSLRIDKPVLDVRRAAGGAIDLAGPWVEAPPRPVRAAPVADTASPWQVDIEKAAITDGTLRVDDAAVRPAFRATYRAVTIDATDLSTSSTKRAHLRATLASDLGARASADVDMIPATLEARGHVAVDKLGLKRLYPYYAEALNLDVQDGALSIAADFAYVPDPKDYRFTLTAGEASLVDLKLALAGERTPLWRVPRVLASGISIDVPARRVDVATLESRGGTAALVRSADGGINFARLLKTSSAPAGVGAGTGTTSAAATAQDATWLVAVKRTVFDRYAIDFTDAVPSPAVALKLRNVDVQVEDLTNARARHSHVRLSAATADGGRIAIDGPVGTQPLAAQLRVEASGLALAPLQPYVDPYVDVTVTGGALAISGRLDVGAAEGAVDAAIRTHFAGDVTISGFGALDTPTHDELARWGKLTLAGVDVVSDPRKLAIGGITLEDFFARVIVYDDATLNIVRLLKPQRADAGAANTGAVAPGPVARTVAVPTADSATARGSATGAMARDREMPVSIGRVTLARGNVRYADFYIRPNYAADLAEVNGTVSSMSATQAGTVDIAAKVARTAPVTVKGTLNPFARELSLDLAGTARDVDLPPLTPYSIKYAGYGITKGTLSFDVHYRIENRKLSADNKLKLDQLTFGEHVDSPTATKLPVLLAVALLKDVNGVIDIELPIAGSLDDPQFSVGGLIVRVIVNLLTKAVTAPFALLGAAFGGGGEELSYIAFEPGTPALPAAAADKIDKLGKALAGRPSLRLDITGRSDAAADSEAMRHAIVAHSIRAQKVKALVDAGTPPADAAAVVVAPDERERYLLAAYKEAPIKERPRNFFGILKDVPPADMEAMLYAHATAGPDALRMLAQERAQAVKQALVAKGVAGERLFVVADTKPPDAKGAPPTRADLALK
ncbi:MAG TPA: DUF748 domain-containing protein [Casimicrobiaceae bacterium]|nr:DUF748 domain-containing protein [Casimicrobiaceae bacterium]